MDPRYVLVIDDEKGLRDMLSYALTRRGFRVQAVESGGKGLEAARAGEHDAVLCDIMMSDMSGLDVLAALKKERPSTEVILATGFPSSESAEQAASLGAFAYLAKPYDLMALFALLDEAAALKASRRAS